MADNLSAVMAFRPLYISFIIDCVIRIFFHRSV